ncbi:hypothetical protein SEA_CHEWYVIII_58 [Rhodococcus phage ChewyVIII]|uniref:Uncharacterized protein n=1 Tax=Rhodococcus phage ChewyVIII TaxID=1887657 RepID=A0A1C9EIA7_9CAUD|nr:hypothetical protein QEH30_gp58 [Rhodococcus phage ChewyVIII]AON97480.1 hypothetical protein SEA_CHEWYVIII_58 [Rhodococcus phage ChewyVIII]
MTPQEASEIEVEEIVDKTLKALRNLSIGLAVFALVTGCLYSFAPEYLVRRPLPDGQSSVVQFVESIGPVWPFLFWSIAILVALAAIYRRGVLLAHCIAVFAWAFYGGCIVAGAILSQPPTPIVTGVMALSGASLHWLVAKVWAAEGIR